MQVTEIRGGFLAAPDLLQEQRSPVLKTRQAIAPSA